jgi:Tfp pilus assembly protein PilV
MVLHNNIKTGFTTLEMLISVVLLVVGSLATLKMFGLGMMADNNIEHSTIALALAQGEMESIKNAGSWSAIDSFASPSTNLGGQFPDFNQEVIVSGDPKNVQVILYWNSRGAVQNLELDTLMTDYNY